MLKAGVGTLWAVVLHAVGAHLDAIVRWLRVLDCGALFSVSFHSLPLGAKRLFQVDSIIFPVNTFKYFCFFANMQWLCTWLEDTVHNLKNWSRMMCGMSLVLDSFFEDFLSIQKIILTFAPR